jgi:uncharacterized protein YndB with AHSA1/START domain
MTSIRIVRDYPYPPAAVWRAVTDPDLIPRWTATGAGGRPEGFAPVAGTKFRFVAKPKPGWNGVVNCEVLEVREPSLLRFSWAGDDGGDVTEVAYLIEPRDGGSRFTYAHTGFTGIGGFVMARLLGSVRKKMLTVGLPAVLADLDGAGAPRRLPAQAGLPQGRARPSWAAASRVMAVWSTTTVSRVQPASRYRPAVPPSVACTPTGLPAAAQAAQIRVRAWLSAGSSGSGLPPRASDRSPGPT